MKSKLLKALFLGFIGVMGLSSVTTLTACDNGNQTEEDKVMTYSEFMAAEVGDDVLIEGFVAAKQSWWDNKATIYLVDEVGTGYFVYNASCTEEEYNTYTVGTYVSVKGVKGLYAEEHEVAEGGVVTVKETTKTMPTTAYDITSIIGNSDALEAHQNCYFTATLTVKDYDGNGAAFAFAVSGATKDNPSGDLYFTLTDGTNDLACCVESYLTGTSTTVYQTVMNLEVGKTVTVIGYLYWWNGANPHITSISVD